MSDWLPIDTAPRDGSLMILWFPEFAECGWHIGYWDADTDDWRNIYNWRLMIFGKPTLWHELPEEPA